MTLRRGRAAIATSETEPQDPGALGREAGAGLGWSFANNIVGRLGNFLAGIVVVRLLAQEQYGMFAVGLVVLHGAAQHE